MIRRSKAYIAGHYGDPISLNEVAKAMHVSTFYFCKIFKKATGMTFTISAASAWRRQKTSSFTGFPSERDGSPKFWTVDAHNTKTGMSYSLGSFNTLEEAVAFLESTKAPSSEK